LPKNYIKTETKMIFLN